MQSRRLQNVRLPLTRNCVCRGAIASTHPANITPDVPSTLERDASSAQLTSLFAAGMDTQADTLTPLGLPDALVHWGACPSHCFTSMEREKGCVP
jgi:hypothetical protein